MNVVVLALVGLLDLGRRLLDVGSMNAIQHHARENLLMSEILLPIRARIKLAHPLPFPLFISIPLLEQNLLPRRATHASEHSAKTSVSPSSVTGPDDNRLFRWFARI